VKCAHTQSEGKIYLLFNSKAICFFFFKKKIYAGVPQTTIKVEMISFLCKNDKTTPYKNLEKIQNSEIYIYFLEKID
jgi:hypothetical protein